MSFGKMPLANGFLEKKNFNKEFFYNLETSFNDELSLFQINEHPKPSQMFNKNYPFFTSSSKFMIDHFKKYSNWIKNEFIKKNSKLIEVGSNDGTFLKNFNNSDIHYIGFEPSYSAYKIAKERKVKTLNEFFSLTSLNKVKEFKNKTDLIVGSNVICHIPNLVEFIKSTDLMLNDTGTLIFEEPYLGSMYAKTSYDQIYDEHIFMFSITSVYKIFKNFGFDLVDAIPQTTHGGSMRYIIKRNSYNNNLQKIKKLIEIEKKLKISTLEGCFEFKENCELSKIKLLDKLEKIKKSNKNICGYGATSKSTTILNYCGIGPQLIECIFDTTKEKVGKYSPGMHIQIKDYKHFRKKFYNYCYLFAWNHKNEIFKKEYDYTKAGGKWITHVKL